jgi:hypothetical protein
MKTLSGAGCRGAKVDLVRAEGLLPPHNLNLPAQRQHLGPQLGSVVVARCDRVEYDVDKRVEHRGHHDGRRS